MNKLIEQAFTLIELLVVIAIIGILSGLIVVTMSGVSDKANLAKAQVFSNSLKNSLMLNLISEWKLEGNANDSWGSNNGTITGATTSSDCVYGQCLNFSGAIGTPQCVTVNSSTSIDTSDKTIGVWINSVNGGETHKSIVGKFHWNGINDEEGYDIWLNGSNTLYATVGSSTRNNVSAVQSSIIVPGKWFYVVMTHDSVSTTNNLKLYINGILKDYKSVTGYTPATALSLGIGRESSYDYFYFLGKIDEVRYYNAVMSAFQIKEQYCVGLNKLLAAGQITRKDYIDRISELAISSLD